MRSSSDSKHILVGTAASARHLHRKIQHSVSQLRDGTSLPHDILQDIFINPQFAGQTGFPEAADSVAYEPTQSLLAVATSDGRVKIVGKLGVEATIHPASQSPTVLFAFVKNQGALIRVTKDGDVELFSISGRRLLSAIKIKNEIVTSVAAIPKTSYILIGCASGDIKVIGVLSKNGKPAEGAVPAAVVKLYPYQILAEDLDSKGAVVAISATAPSVDRPIALLTHRYSGTLIWDLRAERIVCAALDDETEESHPVCSCWVGSRANAFAVGYDDGSILIWGIPPKSLVVDPLTVMVPQEAELLMSLTVAPLNKEAGPVASLQFIRGGPPPAGNDEDCLLVRGGQPRGEPEMLTLLPLRPQSKGWPVEGDGHKVVPWFGNIQGYAVVEDKSLMVLTEGGQIIVHDLRSWTPTPVMLPAQELPPITMSKLIGVKMRSPELDTDERGLEHELTLAALRACSPRLMSTGEDVAQIDWPFKGGISELCTFNDSTMYHPSGVLFTGHRDGRVRVWDASLAVPQLLHTIPASGGAEKLKAVTCMDVCPHSGLIIVGHCGGDARLYQFCDQPQDVHRANLDEARLPYEHVMIQAAGFQYVTRYSVHDVDLTALSLASLLKLVAVADAKGCVSLLDLMQPSQLFYSQPFTEAVNEISFGISVTSHRSGQTIERMVLYASLNDSSVAILGLEDGSIVGGKALKPKNTARPLSMTLLGPAGELLAPFAAPTSLPWANNNDVSSNAMEESSLQVEEVDVGETIEVQELPSSGDELETTPVAAQKRLRFNFKVPNIPNVLRKRDILTSQTPDKDQPSTPTQDSGTIIDPLAALHSYYENQEESSPLPECLQEDAPSDPGEMGPCSYVLLASEDALRVYSTQSISIGDRTSERKVRLEEPAGFAGAFTSVSGPGIAVIAADGSTLTIYSVPGLQQLYKEKLSTALGFPWGTVLCPTCGCSCATCIRSPCASSRDGQIILAACANEVARLVITPDAVLPTMPKAIFCWELAKESAAMKEAEASMTLPVAAPPLSKLFLTFVTSLAELDIVGEEADLEQDPKAKTSPIKMKVARNSSPTPKEKRAELFGSSRGNPPSIKQAKVHMRTTSEIKRNYGRAGVAKQNDKFSGVRGVIEKTRDALVDRGEKLRGLQDKSAAMANDAEDFASMARKLEEAYANRKWWQV